ncbi:MAG TPA: SDR family NAD(P)-dependent oxidoreductase, partial [Phenylobacterium sp.]|nr:SDR family NAD(P)-dependent oxidoreductase [Phenylobacterium sp.]
MNVGARREEGHATAELSIFALACVNILHMVFARRGKSAAHVQSNPGETPAMTDQFLAGRTAFITGASSGLGRHFAHLLAGFGARVALAARRTDRLDAEVAAIRSAGGGA